MIPLAVFEEVIDASGIAPRIEAMLPAGARARQLKVRTLLAGMCLAAADHRPAHLTRVHQALISWLVRFRRPGSAPPQISPVPADRAAASNGPW